MKTAICSALGSYHPVFLKLLFFFSKSSAKGFFSLPALIQFASSLSNLSNSEWLVHVLVQLLKATELTPTHFWATPFLKGLLKKKKTPKKFTLFKSCPQINFKLVALPPSLASIAQLVLFLFGFFSKRKAPLVKQAMVPPVCPSLIPPGLHLSEHSWLWMQWFR